MLTAAVTADREDLERTVQSLALGKKRVLLKRPPTKEIDDDDEILFNKNFEDAGRNVRINTIQVQETVRQLSSELLLTFKTWFRRWRKTKPQKKKSIAIEILSPTPLSFGL
jgi:hypothetical protein